MNARLVKLALALVNTGKVGTVFGKEAQLNITLAEVLRKQKQF
ncbi:hypothetical protein [Brasilonema bromeliae]|nr:hypothetical protein [Brasilonema bromeliae]